MKLVNKCIEVQLHGNRENQPIVFIHGFPYDHTMWNAQVNELKNDYYVVTYDIRGLGQSYVGDGQYTMEAYVHDLNAVIDELGLDNPIICGLSMGGYIALRAIESNTDKYAGLILCDTKAEDDDKEAKLKRAAGIDKINVSGLESFVEDFVPNCFAPKSIKEKSDIFEHTLNVARSHNKTGVKGALIAMLSRTNTSKSLNKINVPTLVVCGTNDKLTPPEVMEKMTKKIPNSTYKKVPNAGHMSPLENPEAFNKALRSFLKKVK